MIAFILAVCGNVDYIYTFPQSPPSRAAWIEIAAVLPAAACSRSPPSRAAWIEIPWGGGQSPTAPSPPSRAAWIEIKYSRYADEQAFVAAFTGGVD